MQWPTNSLEVSICEAIAAAASWRPSHRDCPLKVRERSYIFGPNYCTMCAMALCSRSVDTIAPESRNIYILLDKRMGLQVAHTNSYARFRAHWLCGPIACLCAPSHCQYRRPFIMARKQFACESSVFSLQSSQFSVLSLLSSQSQLSLLNLQSPVSSLQTRRVASIELSSSSSSCFSSFFCFKDNRPS